MRSTNPRDVAYMFRDYARIIHRKAVPEDPNFIALSVACGKVRLLSLSRSICPLSPTDRDVVRTLLPVFRQHVALSNRCGDSGIQPGRCAHSGRSSYRRKRQDHPHSATRGRAQRQERCSTGSWPRATARRPNLGVDPLRGSSTHGGIRSHFRWTLVLDQVFLKLVLFHGSLADVFMISMAHLYYLLFTYYPFSMMHDDTP